MKSFKYVIPDPLGIHARPAGLFTKEAKTLSTDVKILANGKEADAKKLLQVMTLGIRQGQEVEIQVSGETEDADAAVMEAFMKANL